MAEILNAYLQISTVGLTFLGCLAVLQELGKIFGKDLQVEGITGHGPAWRGKASI